MYCNYCLTNKIDIKENKIQCESKNCDNQVFLNPRLAVLGVVFKSDEILLVKRNIEPHYNQWSLPAGYVDYGESPEDAVKREIFEETNIKIKVLNLIDVKFNEISKVTIICYKANYVSGEIMISEECKDVKFFKLKQLPKLPFENDNQLIKLLINK
tara:strand:- start:249 stop:716 length:468 start_codon:yes stop_codon:yes gene_type:complete